MTQNNRSGTRTREGGFSLIEAVVALAVFAGLGAAVMSVAVVSFQALANAHVEMESASEIGLAEDSIRKAAEEIRFPIWLSGVPDIEDGDGFSIPYLHGDKDLFFKMSFEDGRLTIDAPTDSASAESSRRRFTIFSKMEWELLKSEKDEPYGLKVTLQPGGPDAKPIEVAARFGSAPLGKADE